jgi:hypothetical protein
VHLLGDGPHGAALTGKPLASGGGWARIVTAFRTPAFCAAALDYEGAAANDEGALSSCAKQTGAASPVASRCRRVLAT